MSKCCCTTFSLDVHSAENNLFFRNLDEAEGFNEAIEFGLSNAIYKGKNVGKLEQKKSMCGSGLVPRRSALYFGLNLYQPLIFPEQIPVFSRIRV